MSSEEAKQLKEEFRKICAKIKDEAMQPKLINNETNTRVVLINPFLDAMGYNARDPLIVDAEFTADVGTRKKKKADYSIFHESGKPVMLMEAKPLGTILDASHENQLREYFHAKVEVKIGVLTNGQRYRFYSDTDNPNVLDAEPYLEFDICKPTDEALEVLVKYRMPNILETLDNISEDARRFKYRNQAKQLLADEFGSPSEEFVKLLARRLYEGTLSKRRLEYFEQIIAEASKEVLQERVEARLAKALATNAGEKDSEPDGSPSAGAAKGGKHTSGELKALDIFKGIGCPEVSADRLEIKKSGKRTVIAIDSKNKPWVAYIDFPSSGKCDVDIRTEPGPNGSFWGHCRKLDGISRPEDLFQHASAIKQAILCYR